MSNPPVQPPFPMCSWVHDPSGQPMNYSVPLPVPSTDTVTTVTVTPVDVNDVPLSVGVPTVSFISWSVVATATGLAWFVTFWLTGGTAGTLYNLRCRWSLSDGRGSDRTVALLCANT